MSRCSVEKFLSHRIEKLCMGTILCCVLESFRYRINLWMRSGGVSNSYVEFFCLTLSKTAVGELFSLSIISGIEKVRMRDWGGGSVKISVENFLSHSDENFVG